MYRYGTMFVHEVNCLHKGVICMYFKLALRNVKKSYKEYLIYFLTLMFSVCLFYTFNSFQAQQEMMIFQDAQDSIMGTASIFMAFLSVFIIVVLAFLILYANRFLIKQRKKEFGLYMLMGMEHREISRILVYETFFIGLLSLISGLVLGLFLSQGLALYTASILAVEVSFRFVFSLSAMWMSVCSFSGIFLILMVLNTRIMRKQNLIELLSASKRNEKQRLNTLLLSVVLFIISIVLLGSAYYLATVSLMSFGVYFSVIIVCGIVGTLLFFFSLSGFLLRFIQVSKHTYYRNLNMFVLRSIHERINTNFLSMSLVCLMLLLSIGALSTGWNLNAGMKLAYEQSTPIDVSLVLNGQSNFEALTYPEEDVVYRQDLHMYDSGIELKEILSVEDKEAYPYVEDNVIPILPYSQYKAFCEQQGITPIALTSDSYMMFTQMANFEAIVETYTEENKTITLGSYTLTPIVQEESFFMPYTGFTGSTLAGIIVQDERIPKDATITQSILNMNLSDGIEEAGFSEQIASQLQSSEIYWQITTRNEVIENSLSVGVLFTYIGLYLGVVFLISSAVILALQQLSQAQENRQRYEILRKIGAEEKLMNASIFLQLAIYFLLPLSLAIIHAYFGITAVGSSFTMIFGTGDMVGSSLVTGGIIISIYGAYFLITYQSYKRIIYQSL